MYTRFDLINYSSNIKQRMEITILYNIVLFRVFVTCIPTYLKVKWILDNPVTINPDIECYVLFMFISTIYVKFFIYLWSKSFCFSLL
jgi:hypothetical protein